MKKIVFTLFLIFSSISFCRAFSFDLAKVDFKQERISLESSYKIDTEGFSKIEESKENIKALAKTLVSLSLEENANSSLSNYMYVNSVNGFEMISASLFIKTYLEKLNHYTISFDSIKMIRVVSFSEGDIAFVYIDDALVNESIQDIVFAFWIKEEKLFYPWVTIEKDLEMYFDEVTTKEEEGTIFGGTFKSLSLSATEDTVSEEFLESFYQQHVLSNVQLTGLKQDGVASYGSGFVLREGVIVTSWSLLLEMLREQAFIYITDAKENSYKIEGIVSLNIFYDVVVLKLDKEIQNPVIFGDSRSLVSYDSLFLINSNTNQKYSIRYGSFLSSTNGELHNLFALNQNDVGSALYTSDGYVIGINTSTILNSPESIAHSTNYLVTLQNQLLNTSYDVISSTPLDLFYTLYYTPLQEEETILSISLNDVNSLKGFGDLASLSLPLVKSSREDGYISLRYKNTIANSIDSMYLVASYEESLTQEGYTLAFQSSQKKIYQKEKKQIIIKENMNYIILLLKEV